ncbi:MAG: hypothetical protein ACRD63_10635 [Pyrinomonadaceae bacterium]
MQESLSTLDIDPILLPLLKAADEAESQRVLTYLLWEVARPIIINVVSHKIRRDFYRNLEDVCGDAIENLTKRLLAFKADPSRKEINNYQRYVASIAETTFFEHLRRLNPNRKRLADKLARFLRMREEFAVWNSDHELRYGLAEWRNQKDFVPQSGRIQQLCADPLALQEFLPTLEIHRLSLIQILYVVLDAAAAPVKFNDLIKIVAVLRDVKDEELSIDKAVDSDNHDHPHQSISRQTFLRQNFHVDLILQVEQRESLHRFWQEIGQLSLRQRIVYLLGMREENGGGDIHLILLTEIATINDIAIQVDVTPAWLKTRWNDLPLDNTEIGRMINCTERQVSNMRDAVRRRLARRMALFPG